MARMFCAKCWAVLPARVVNTRDIQKCPFCKTDLRVDTYPALYQETSRGLSGEALFSGDEASCFYHPEKKAVVACAACGRFLCSLCDLDMDGRHLCPPCLEAGAKARSIKSLDQYRVLHDEAALSLAVLPLFVFWITILTAPMTIYYSIKYWKAPLSIVRRTRARFVIAMVLAALQLAGWAAYLLS